MKQSMYTLPKRLIAMILSLVMILSVMPALQLHTGAAEITAGSAVADASTMDEWKDPFLPGGLPTTDYAGAIWTDKSVLTAGSSLPGGVSVAQNNFLIALSALATNSVVTGQGSVPTDVVFVLDISGSMNAEALSGMVAATNNAIRALLAENADNRVGVVLYSTTATTLLPLDHYTGATSGMITTPTFLTYISSQDVITTGIGTYRQNGGGGGGGGGGNGNNDGTYTIIGPTNSADQEIEARVTCEGGTYIQGGLWEAYEDHFGPVTDTANRVPAVILMSDGAPTYVTRRFDNVSATHSNGAGRASYNGDGFVTQLTAAFVKVKLAEKYGKALMYTVGFGLDNIDDAAEKAIATKVLNSGMAHQGIDDLWTTYNALHANGTMSIRLGANNNQLTNPHTVSTSITKSATVLSQNYADAYFAASDAGSLNSAFQNIINAISLQAGYYPTRTDDNGANYSGYITFSDTLGEGMEVKQIEGIMLGGQLLDGHRMAELIHHTDLNNQFLAGGGNPANLPYPEWLGTKEDPTDLGDEFVRAVKQRMGIHVEPADSSEEAAEAARIAANNIAWELIGNAWTTGQLSYTNANDFSNFIGWYGDANGKYMGPYTEGGTAPAGAAYINFCYGLLGASDAFGLESDLMYVTVQVSRNIATDEQIVTFRIPAAMLPTLTYQVEVELDDDRNIKPETATIAVNDASPIVLLYEVGVDTDKVTPLTIEKYGKPTGDGRYYLYTNAWTDSEDKTALKDVRSNSMAYAYYEPGSENEHYYFPRDMVLYDQNGDVYTGAKPTSNVYFKDTIYTATGTPTEGKYKAIVHTELVPMASEDLVNATQNTGDGSWYMPKGSMYANSYDYDLKKATNTTGTHGFVHFGIMDAAVTRDLSHHYELIYQGNNGRLIYEPAQGITLTKELEADAAALEGKEFSFTVAITGDSDNTVTLTQNGTDTQVPLTGNQLTVTLKANETATIWGIDTGAAYTITENITGQDSYLYQVVKVNGQSQTTAAGTVAAYALTPVVFTNDLIDYGAFTVSKTVTYNKGTAAIEGKLATFDVEITLADYADREITVDNVPMITDANGKIQVTIQDGQTITVANVPVGTDYQVTESSAMPDGYTQTVGSGSGTVTQTVTGVDLLNAYTPDDVTPDPEFTITGTKALKDGTGAVLADWTGNSFAINLLKWNGAAWEAIPGVTDTVNQTEKNYTLTHQEIYSAVGDYLYRIVEVQGTVPGMTYDTTHHDFRVQVTDTDLDGKLEMTVTAIDPGVTVLNPSEGRWDVSADFNNIYDLTNATLVLTAKKTLNGRALLDGEFEFILSAVTANAPMPTAAGSIAVTNGKNGDIVFPAISYTTADVGQTYEYQLKETQGTLGGVDYAETVYHISVAVTTSGGHVVATPTITKDAETAPYTGTMEFVNTYQAASTAAGPFEATKTLYDRTPGTAGFVTLAGGEFSFLLQAGDVAYPMPSGAANGQLTLSNDAAGKVVIPSITYNKAGTYTYTLTEVNGGVGGYEYDNAKYTITVVVEDDGSGQLKISSTTFLLNDTTHVAAMSFANYYRAQATGDIALNGQKTFNIANKNLSRTLTDGEFTFILSDASGGIERVTNIGNSFAFTALSFDRAGTYRYTVKELNDGKGGVSYDSKEHELIIEVEDNKAGQLVATATLNGGSVAINGITFSFTNSYDVTDATLPLTATKSMTGRQPLHDEFTFVLTAVTSGAPMPANATVKNGYRGLVDFGTITYTKAGTYKYTIHEDKTNPLGGVTYDETVYTITVQVTDDGNGALTAAITDIQGNEHNDLVFRNIYKAASVTVNLTGDQDANGSKNLNDLSSSTAKTLQDFELEFVLKAEDGTVIETVKDNDLDGFNFADITYTEPQTVVYYIEEVAGSIPGMLYDPTVYKVTVTVTDDQKGQLQADVQYEKIVNNIPEAASAVIFSNDYAAKETEVTFTGLKTFKGGKKLTADMFSFHLTGNGVNETVKNKADGTFTFSPITYTKEGVYVYELTEVKGSDAQVTYDGTKYTLTVTVTDVNGELKATTAISNGQASVESYGFTNIFTPSAGAVTLDIQKILKNESGKEMGLEDFQFQLEGEGKKLTAQSDTAGKAKFTLDFTPADIGKTFTYKLTEINTGVADVTYDTAAYEIKVTVGQNAETGELTFTVTSNGAAMTGAAQFTNTYAPKVDEPPKTADAFNLTGWALMMGMSATGLLAVLVIGKKKLAE